MQRNPKYHSESTADPFYRLLSDPFSHGDTLSNTNGTGKYSNTFVRSHDRTMPCNKDRAFRR